MIIFENKGEIDPVAISTFGVNVKVGERPFGYFGTGLKYALGILLRTGHSVSIQSGKQVYDFKEKITEVRGEQFNLVCMRPRFVVFNGLWRSLGFTTQIGKNWELWMAYRELFCNAKDEGGTAYWADDGQGEPRPDHDTTRVIVRGSEFEEVFKERHRYILEGATPLWTSDDCDIYEGPGEGVYYRGVLVMRWPDDKPDSLYTYNIKRRIDLTEDRVAKYRFEVEAIIANAVKRCENESIVRSVVRAPEGVPERNLDYTGYISYAPQPTFMRVVGEQPEDVNVSALNSYKAQKRTDVTVALRAGAVEVEQPPELKAAREYCERMNYSLNDYKIVDTDDLDEGVQVISEGDTIFVHTDLLDDAKGLAAALLSEAITLWDNVQDATLEKQQKLMKLIVELTYDKEEENVH